MKKSLIALAVLAASGAAFAQSTATISGTISVGIVDTGAAGAKATVSRLGGGANAINIVTAEDLGGGLKGGFDSQMRFNSATGDRTSSGTGGALFHGANVYVGGGFGTVRMGKIIEASNCAFDPWACTGGAGLNAGTTTGGLIAAGTIANAVSFETPNIAGFSASYNTSVSSRTNERSVLNLSYANGPLSAQFLQSKNSANTAGDSLTATTTATTANNVTTYTTTVSGATITDVAGQGTSIGASYDLGMAKVALFNAKTENAAGATTADITGLGLTVPMGAITVLAGYTKDKKKASALDERMALGATYALSKRTTVGADVFKQDQAGGSTGFVIRARHTF
jgi:hypothetical protein